MGSLSSRPDISRLKAKLARLTNSYSSIENKHTNLEECHDALEYLSMKGELKLRRTKKTYTICCNDTCFRGSSLCEALKGLLKRVR